MISNAFTHRKFLATPVEKGNPSKMYKVKRLILIHSLLIYSILICSLEQHGQAHAGSEHITTPLSSISDDLTEQQVKDIKKEYKTLAMERLFDIKGKPSKDTPNPSGKLFVPSAMLKEYIGYRDAVREVVPDDRDFYGRIKIDGASTREDIWSAHIGDYEVEVDIPKDDSPDGESFRGKDASHIALLPLASDPEDVPPNKAFHLPPNTIGGTSVHLKYKLDQEIYSSPTAASDLKKAELRLTREKLSDCDIHDCTNVSKPTPSGQDDSSQAESARTRTPKTPTLQRVFLLQVTGYDPFGELKTRVFNFRQVDVSQTGSIVFDITEVVQGWLRDPSTNHGLIVRVLNGPTRRSKTNKREVGPNNATNVEIESLQSEADVLEHLRLKRAFRSSSASHELWRDTQPSIIIWSKLERSEEPRHHVKRHNSEEEKMQADEPDTTTTESQLSTAAQTTSEDTAQTDKSSHAISSGAHSKRDHQPSGNSSGTRRGPQTTRASNGGRPSSQQSNRSKGKNRPPVKQTDKCSKRSLNINFDEVGWSSWIIAPHSYYANYCSGDCNWPLSDTQNSTNHAIIQSIYRSVGRVGVPKSCCAPVKLGRMAILYQLDGIVQMRLYDDMIVEACGCL